MSLLKNIGKTILIGIKDIDTDIKTFFTKAKPIFADVEQIAIDLLEGKTIPPTGHKGLDAFLTVLQALTPFYKGDKAALMADIQEAVTFFEDAAALFGV